jgi:hypothetical protein
MNIKKLAITLGIAALVLTIVCSALGFGESVYLTSNGQRGWSLGAAFYNAVGWGAEAYRADMAQHFQQHAALQQPGEKGSVPSVDGAYSYGSHHSGMGFNGGRSGHGGGGFFLFAIVGVAGYLFYRKQKQNKATLKAA